MEEGVKRTIDDKDPVDKIICKGGQFNKFIDVLMGDHIDADPEILEKQPIYSLSEVQDLLQQAILTAARNYLDQNQGEHDAVRAHGVGAIWNHIKDTIDVLPVRKAYTLLKKAPGNALPGNAPSESNFDTFYAEYVQEAREWLFLPEDAAPANAEILKRQIEQDEDKAGSSKRFKRNSRSPSPSSFV